MRNSTIGVLQGLGVAVTLAAAVAVLAGQGITIPNTFVNGTVADATQVNSNFTALASNALNRNGGTMLGTLTSQAITPSTDATYAIGDVTHRYTGANFSTPLTVANGGTGASAVPSNGQVLVGNGTTYTVASLGVSQGIAATAGAGTLALAGTLYDRNTANVTVSATTTETQIYAKTVAANDLTSKRLHFQGIGTFFNSSGGAANLTLRVKFGAVTIFDSGAQSVPNGFGGISPHPIEAVITSQTSTTEVAWVNWVFPGASLSNAGATSTITVFHGGHNAVGQTLTGANTFQVTVQPGTNSASFGYIFWGGMMEIQ